LLADRSDRALSKLNEKRGIDHLRAEEDLELGVKRRGIGRSLEKMTPRVELKQTEENIP